MVQINCCCRREQREEGEREEGQGHRSERGADTGGGNLQGLLWGLWNVYILYLAARCLTQPLKQQQHRHRLPSRAAPLQQLCSLTDPLTFSTYVTAWLTANFICPPSLSTCWCNAKQLAHICSRFDRERGISVFKRAHVPFLSSNAAQSVYVNKKSLSSKPRNQRTQEPYRSCHQDLDTGSAP